MKTPITFSYIKNGATHQSARILEQIVNVGGFQILEMKPFQFDSARARSFYAEHKDRPYFEGLWKYTTEVPVLTMLLTHPTSQDVVGDFRKFIGATDPNKAEVGTIRERYGDKEAYAMGLPSNAIHGSDSRESAIREAKLVGFKVAEYE